MIPSIQFATLRIAIHSRTSNAQHKRVILCGCCFNSPLGKLRACGVRRRWFDGVRWYTLHFQLDEGCVIGRRARNTIPTHQCNNAAPQREALRLRVVIPAMCFALLSNKWNGRVYGINLGLSHLINTHSSGMMDASLEFYFCIVSVLGVLFLK